jgi:nucleoside-diphosphate-sugar epimerase
MVQMYTKKKIYIVTGPDGFIGRNLVDRLLKQGSEVVGISKNSSKNSDITSISFNDFINDSYDVGLLDKVSGVFNLANSYTYSSKDKLDGSIFNSNLILPIKLGDVFSRLKVPILLTGTYLQNIYNYEIIPTSNYVLMKNLIEHLFDNYSEMRGLRFASTRQYESYGKGDPRPRILNRLKSNLLNQSSIDLIDQDFELDFLHVSDLVSGLIQIMDLLEVGELGQGEQIELSSRKYIKYSELLILLENLFNMSFVPPKEGEFFRQTGIKRLHLTTNWPKNWTPTIDFKVGLGNALLSN